MIIRTKCKKCGVTIRLDFGELTKEAALALAKEMDQTPRECPGMHMELGGFRQLWSLDDAIHRGYDLGEQEETEPVETDKEHVERMLADGRDVIDGGLNTVPELLLPSLHDFPGLEHLGFGNFRSATHLFLRRDSPRGTRFYLREPAPVSAPATIPA